MSAKASEMEQLKGDTEFFAWLSATHGSPIEPDAVDFGAVRAHINAPGKRYIPVEMCPSAKKYFSVEQCILADRYRSAQANKLLRLWREFRPQTK